MRSNKQRKRGKLQTCVMFVVGLVALEALVQTYLSFNTPALIMQANSVQSKVNDRQWRHSKFLQEELLARSLMVDMSGPEAVLVLSEGVHNTPSIGVAFTALTSTSYEIKLVGAPKNDVAVVMKNQDGCFSKIIPAGVVFHAQNWRESRMVKLELNLRGSNGESCEEGHVMHELFSTDPSYDGLVVSMQPLLVFNKRHSHGQQKYFDLDQSRWMKQTADKVGTIVDTVVAVAEKDEPLQSMISDTENLLESPSEPKNDAKEENPEIAILTKEELAESTETVKVPPSKENTNPEDKFPTMPSLATDISAVFERYNCSETKFQNKAVRCVLAENTIFSTYFYIIDSPKLQAKQRMNAPVALITGGVHGRELAGFEAAGAIKTWIPSGGRLIVIDKLNRRGIERHTRYVPTQNSTRATVGSSASKIGHESNHEKTVNRTLVHDDLNRDFPPNLEEFPKTNFAKLIWELCEAIKPKLFLDLHEGWGYYAQLKQNEAGNPDHLLSNPKFSKGSSVIATENALLMAKHMVDAVNDNIKEPKHRFEVLSPPIDGGLARRMYHAFNTQCFVLETTQLNQPVEKRVAQHLKMVSSLLSRVGFLPRDFQPPKPRHKRVPHIPHAEKPLKLKPVGM